MAAAAEVERGRLASGPSAAVGTAGDRDWPRVRAWLQALGRDPEGTVSSRLGEREA